MGQMQIIQYMLYGAFIMLQICACIVLLHRRQANEPSGSTQRAVGAMTILTLAYTVTWAAHNLFPTLRYNTELIHILTLSSVIPFVYIISHSIRYGHIPTARKIALHYLSLLLPIAYMLTSRKEIAYVTILYTVVYLCILLVNHAFWFVRHRDMWVQYDDRYRKQHVWQIWLIIVPIVLLAILYAVIILGTPRPWTTSIFLILCIVLGIVITERSYLDQATPNEETDCISVLEDSAAMEAANNATALPESIKAQIAKRLAEAEQNKLHLEIETNLDIYAQYVGTNRTYLSRYLNQELNTTFCDYLNNKRLEYAITLLTSDKKYIADVAYMCGYADTSTFRRNFKKYIGTTPRRYRQGANSATKTKETNS